MQNTKFHVVPNNFIPSNIHDLTLGKPAKYTYYEFLMLLVNENVTHDNFLGKAKTWFYY